MFPLTKSVEVWYEYHHKHANVLLRYGARHVLLHQPWQLMHITGGMRASGIQRVPERSLTDFIDSVGCLGLP